MAAPRTYAEWLPLLDRFREGDDATLTDLKDGTIEWTSIVAERWTTQVTGCLQSRLESLSRLLQTGLDRAGGDYFAIANTLLTTRRALVPLRAFVTLPAVPPEVGSYLGAELDRWIEQTQKSLERHASGVWQDQGRLLKVIRDNALTAAPPSPPPPASNPGSDLPVPAGRGRRIIF